MRMQVFAGMMTGPDGNQVPTFRAEHPYMVPGNHKSRTPGDVETYQNEDGLTRHRRRAEMPWRTVTLNNLGTGEPIKTRMLFGILANLLAAPVSRQTRRARERFEAKYQIAGA